MKNWYKQELEKLILKGLAEAPRGLATVEFKHMQFTMPIGTTVITDRFNPRIGVVEALALLAGVNSKDHLKLVAPKSVEDGWFDYGVDYGPRLRGQLAFIVEELRQEPNSRRAVLHIGHPRDYKPLDRPCMQYVQFLVRENELSLHLAMRSWDSTRGFPSDIVVWGLIGLFVAKSLNVKPGLLVATAGSWHLYESDMYLVPSADIGPCLKLDRFYSWPTYMGAWVNWAVEQLADLHKCNGIYLNNFTGVWNNTPVWLHLGDKVGSIDVHGYY